MKKLLLLIVFLTTFTFAQADWISGTCSFKGNMPTQGKVIGGVRVWYNGSLSLTHTEGGVQYWEGTAEICVIFPKDYKGPKMVFLSTGGMVQVQYE